jgi:transcriptional regulator with XRE-family HTH domain
MTTAAKTTRVRSPRPARSRKKPATASAVPALLREEFGITRRLLARLTGLSERSLATWETGGKLNEASRRAILGVERLLRALAEVVRTEAIAGWLETPNEAFDGLKPVEVTERGEEDRLWRMIYFLGSGTLS